MTAVLTRVATRRSTLARRQAAQVADAVAALTRGPVALVEVTTQGDVDAGPLTSIGGTGVFVTAVRQAVLDGRADLAVHSCKDLPTAPADGLVLAAVPTRSDPRDVLVSRHGRLLADLPPGARVGTGSPRRAAALRAARPDVEVVDVRGNVDTRLGLLASRDLDAVVLAAAGLARLGRSDVASEVFGPDVMLPAPGQGALAVEATEHVPAALADALAALDDHASRCAVQAERRLLATLEAGCAAPVGAWAVAGAAETLDLRATVTSPDGRRVLRAERTGDVSRADDLGRDVAQMLLMDGAADLVAVPTEERAP